MLKGDLIIGVGLFCAAIVALMREIKSDRKNARSRNVIIIVEILFIVASAYLVPWGFQLRTKEIEAMTGKLASPEIDFQKPFEIILGNNIILQTISQLDEGIDLNKYINIGYDYPIQIKFKGNKLLITAEIKNQEGITIAKIVDNNWVVNENKMIAWDRNYNEYAFEVLDSNLIPVLQIVVKEQNKIYVGGLFYTSTGKIVISQKIGIIINPSEADLSKYITPIFKYPSNENLGKMVKTNN